MTFHASEYDVLVLDVKHFSPSCVSAAILHKGL